MKILQINTTYNIGSTGRIVAGIENVIENAHHEAYIAYGYGYLQDNKHYRIINKFDSYRHNVVSRLTDSQGLHSSKKTHKLIEYIEHISPDIIHLHNLHGNYLDYRVLFSYLHDSRCRVIWTFHDCWPFTGHCAYFDMANCKKWIYECSDCLQRASYPPAVFDRCKRNYSLKRSYFTSLGNSLTIVPVSFWLADLLEQSYFNKTSIHTIHNGIDLDKFKYSFPTKENQPYILGVASPWDRRKGLSDFIELRQILSDKIQIILVGLSKNQISKLPAGIKGIPKTNSVKELVELYSGAKVLVNPTYEDNYPTVNLESIACGTPVITYNTGGSPESISPNTGIILEKGDIGGIKNNVEAIVNGSLNFSAEKMEKYALGNFNEKDCFNKYLELYKNVTL